MSGGECSVTSRRRRMSKKGVFACNIDLLYDLISGERAPGCGPSEQSTAADVDDTEIRVKRCTLLQLSFCVLASSRVDDLRK